MGLAQDRADDGASQSTGQTGPGGVVASNNDAASDKDASAAREAAREARVERRLNHLELLRNIGMEIAAGLGHAAARRHQFDTSAFARIADPAASFNRLSLAIRRIVALEELLEEDAATRAAQLAAQRALQERRAARERAEEEKQIVRRTVRMAHSDANPGIERDRQENLLNDLFDNYELYNEGPLAEVVANICTDLGLIPDLRHWGEAPEEGCEPDPVKIRARTLETAAEYLELVMNPDAATSAAAPPATSPPAEGGRGPP